MMDLTIEQTKKIVEDIYKFYGYNILNYNMTFIRKRLLQKAHKYNATTFSQLHRIIISDETVIHNLFDNIFINVSDFFRDSEVFKIIRNTILPFISSYPTIKIWSAGCATGQEVYSLAILLKELGLYDRSIIYATDIDSSAIEIAKKGQYPITESLKGLENYYLSDGKQRISQYFDIGVNNYLTIKEELKKNIYFSTHNLITDDTFNQFSLILCRNMFIYFDNDLQFRGLNIFYESLENSGFLVLGKSESMLLNNGYSLFKDFDKNNRIFKKA
jgi:chemotaxis protein methyltransferase CheR